MIFKRFNKKALTIFVVLLYVGTFSFTAMSDCTNIVVGKAVTTDGSVITSHTVDGRYDSRINIIPAQDHEEGSMHTVYYGKDRKIAEQLEREGIGLREVGEIPQVPHTYKIFQTAYSFANEHQLIISETTQGGALETINSEEAIMSIRELEILALQRCKTAREAVELMGSLAVEYGFAETARLGEAVTIIDPDEAWAFEVYGAGPIWTRDSGTPGAAWAAVRVPDNHVTVNPNYSRFNFDPADPNLEYEILYSEGYKELAVELGIYDANEEFVWNRAYGDVKGKADSDRLWRLYSLLTPSQEWKLEDTADYPFSIEPEMKLSVQDVIEMFRDTHEGTPYDMANVDEWYYTDKDGKRVKSPLATPQVRSVYPELIDLLGISPPYTRVTGITGCSSYWVGQARDWFPAEIGGILWYGLNNPENGPFIPLYVGVDEVPKSYTVLNRDEFDRNSAWWAYALVDYYVNLRYQELKPKLDEELLKPMHEYWYAMQEGVESKALEIYNNEGSEAVREFLTMYSKSQMEWAEARYWEFADVLIFDLTRGR